MRSPLLPLALTLTLAACGSSVSGTNEDGGVTNDTGTTTTDDVATGDDAAAIDDVQVPADVPVVACTSGRHWTGGTLGSQSMNPGLACIACHSTRRGAPRFSFAGTVFPSSHEEDLCNGAAGITVEVTDNAGQVVTVTTNSAGNFFSQTPVMFPIHARVTAGGREAHMLTAQSSGDCNSCHTQDGANGAPGRIVAP